MEISTLEFKLKYNYGNLKQGTTCDLDDLLDEIDRLQNNLDDAEAKITELEDHIEELEQQIEDNYRPIPVAEQYGISDKDLI